MASRTHRRRTIASALLIAVTSISIPFVAAAQTAPEGWTVSDVGDPSIPGYASESNGTYTVSGGGDGIGGRSDAFTFLQREVPGDATIVARVHDVRNGGSGAKAGVMIRQTLAAGSRHAFIYVTPSRTVGVQRRRLDGVNTGQVTNQAGGTSPIWVRLQRSGETFTAAWSRDGVNWTTMWSESMSMDGVTHVGLAVTSHNDAASAIGTFSGVEVADLSQSDATLPAGWSSGDVGSPLLRGSATYGSGTFGLEGAGSGIGRSADQFQYAYRREGGDLEIVARVRALSSVDPAAKAGVMIRESLTESSRHASMLVTRGMGTIFQRRRNTGSGTVSTGGGSLQAPVWVRLTVAGTTVRGYQSVDGANWILVGSDNIALGSDFYVGLAITSSDPQLMATASVDHVTVTASGGNQAPQVSLTAPAPGATYTAPATLTVTANASDSDGTVARVDFYHGSTLIGTDTSQPYSASWSDVAAGSYSLTAVATDDDGARTTSGAVSITVTASNSPPSVTLTAPANGATFTAPASIPISASASDADGTVARVEFYNGSTLIGTDASAPYGMTWSSVPAGTYTLTATAVDNDGATRTSAGHTVTVNGANQPPSVSLTAPASGATYTAPASITISASASDTNGSIARVEFFAGSTLVGTDTSSPYSVTWNNVPAGSYSLTARAVDNGGASTTSAARSVTVNGANQPPAVSLTAPANGATYTAPATITVSASAADTDGSIARVEFFAGSTLLGTDTTAPYSITWNNVGAGAYSLTARAVDNGGAATTSAARSITVNSPPPSGPAAVFYPSPDHNTLVNSYRFEVFAAGVNPNTATPLRTQDLGKPPVVNGEISADISATINALASGNYQATVAAVGTGGVGRSAAVNFTK